MTKRHLTAAALSFILISFVACQYTPIPTGRIDAPTTGISRVAVVGLQADSSVEDSITPAELDRFSQMMVKALVKKKYIPLPPGRVQGSKAAILAKSKGLTQLRLWQEVGRELKADAILVGSLYRYSQKMTRRSTPASVGMTLELIRVGDGHLIWRGRYDETQKPILSNLLSVSRVFKRGIKWASAFELAQSGLLSLLQAVPGPGYTPE